jgi:hypothetical protein
MEKTVDRLNLGGFIDALAALDPNKSIAFDFGYFAPDSFMSWRGAYEQLALSFEEGKSITVGALLDAAREAEASSYEGYKGGTYRMSRDSKLWVANYGDANWTGITGVEERGYHAIINTAWFEDDL